MKCVLYARVSSKEQEKEGFSIPAQQKLLREYAAKHRLKVVSEFTDVETAKAAGRTQFSAMVQFLKDNAETRIVLVEKTDRLYRNFRDYVLLGDLDLEIHLVKEGEVISKDSKSHAKFIHGIKVLMAKNYIDNLSEEVKKGLFEKAEAGEWPHRAPLGYTNDRESRQLVVDEDRASTIRQLFEAYATGRHSISSLRSLARDLGLTYRGSNKPVSRSWIEKMLQNPIYTGVFRWKGKVYQGTHAPILSQDVFEQVQSVVSDVSKPKCNDKKFAFRGLLRCGYCGCSITAEIKKGKYVYYRCTNGRGKCEQAYVPEKRLSVMLGQLVEAITIDKALADEIQLALTDSFDDEKKFRAKETSKLRRECDKVQARIEQCYQDKLDGTIDVCFWQSTHDRLIDQQNRVARRLAKLEDSNRSYYQEGVSILELAQSAYSLYKQREPVEQANLLRTLLSNCEIKGLTLYPTYRKPFNYFVDTPRNEIWRRR
ncbi:MAG: recombinase family protein [candidate division Zixibacteria bacterium]|nr:recombinase family protein [candidate division Zixibacteria bacterium]MDH3938939.1 recombinase family protein [candidate division Zixibacteria bacterium]MDH4032599.1 recombinase family protein [candidate division Zixibacteria bacterium]